MKPSKTAGYDNINVNVIKKTYEELKTTSTRIFNLLFSTGIFPGKLKIEKIFLIFKNNENHL